MGLTAKVLYYATDPMVKIALGIGGIVAVVAAYLGIISQQAAASYIMAYLAYLGINMGHSEYVLRKLEAGEGE